MTTVRVGSVQFEWDPAKETANRRKHAISFAEAIEVFEDPLALVQADTVYPERMQLLGESRRAESSSWCTLNDGAAIVSVSSPPVEPQRTNEAVMPNDDPSPESLVEMPEVTDWSRARRNPYAARLGVLVLPADLAVAFPDDAAVATALRDYLSKKSA